MGAMFAAIANSTEFEATLDDSMVIGSGRKKLPNVNTIEQIVELIRNSSNILVLTGAGISVSAGIPDFRSENGLYCSLKEEFNLDDPSAMFDIHYFIKDPSLFYSLSGHICPGFDENEIKYYPTPTHYFIKSLELKSKLLRNYTQNIDTLEMRAGLKNIVTCHGSYSTASCINCQFKVNGIHIEKHLFNAKIAFCPYCCPHKSDLKYLLKDINNESNTHKAIITQNKGANILFIRLPKLLCCLQYLEKCPILLSFDENILQKAIYDVNEIDVDDTNNNFKILVLKCNDRMLLQICKDAIMQWLQTDVMLNSFGCIKPDVVFFNECLSKNYRSTLQADIKQCDLLLVIGTSLQVEPVSLIPNMIANNIPCVLINREVVGYPNLTFDVNLLGKCDDICMTLMHKLNWKAINETKEESKDFIDYEFIPPNYYLFPNGKLPPPSYVFPERESQRTATILSDVDMIVNDIIKEERGKSGNKPIETVEINKCDIHYFNKQLLIYGYIRGLSNKFESLLLVMDIICNFYTRIPMLTNCFFMYGALRDDIDIDGDGEGANEWCDGCDGYLGIVYGFKLFGSKYDRIPFAKQTGNKNDYIIGRIIHFGDDLEFECQLNWADAVNGYDANVDDLKQNNMFIRKYVQCYIFDELNDKELTQMGYYDTNTIIDFTNKSKIKQYAHMYCHPNEPNIKIETPHSDWIKRFVIFS